MSFFPLAECSLSVMIYVSLSNIEKLCQTHAARFCALRLDCAGVRSSLSTLFDLLSCPGSPSLSKSRAMLFSKESLDSSEMCCAVGEAELELCAAPRTLPLDPTDASKLYSKADGMKPFASNEVSMLYIVPRISNCARIAPCILVPDS